MSKKTVILAVLFLTIFYFTTDVLFVRLEQNTNYLFLLLILCFVGMFEGVIAALIASRVLKEKMSFSYGIVFLALYMVLLLIGYMAIRTAVYNLEFLLKYWIYFPSFASVIHMPFAVGGHLFTLYILSKRKHN